MVKKANRLFRSSSSFFLIAEELGLYRVPGNGQMSALSRCASSAQSQLSTGNSRVKTLHLFLVFTLGCPSELFFMDS